MYINYQYGPSPGTGGGENTKKRARLGTSRGNAISEAILILVDSEGDLKC